MPPQIKDLKAANIDVNGEFLAYSPEAAAALVDGSPASELASDTSLTFDLLRDGSIKDAYPIVMVSYLIGCQTYEDASTAANVQAYFTYVASAEGRQMATEAGAGNAPISEELRARCRQPSTPSSKARCGGPVLVTGPLLPPSL